MMYVLQKWSYNFHSVSQKTIWTLTKRSLRFVTLDNRRKKGPTSFVYLEDRLFLEIIVSNNLLRPIEQNLSLAQENSEVLLDRYRLFRDIVMFDNTEKTGQKISPLQNICPKNCCQHPLRFYRNDLINSTLSVKISGGA